jgi:hypothetical protein
VRAEGGGEYILFIKKQKTKLNSIAASNLAQYAQKALNDTQNREEALESLSMALSDGGDEEMLDNVSLFHHSPFFLLSLFITPSSFITRILY